MATAVFDSDYQQADAILGGCMCSVRDQIAAAVAGERERCAQIAEAIDSGRGNEKQIARAIRDGKSYRRCSR